LHGCSGSSRLHVTLAERHVDAVWNKASPVRKQGSRASRGLRAQGLRPIQIWVPDTRSRHFAEEAHRQSLAVAASPHAGEDQDFIEAISDRPTE
jgi:hypothetical protein